MDSTNAPSRSRYRERRLNNVKNKYRVGRLITTGSDSERYPHDDVSWYTMSHQFIETRAHLQQPREHIIELTTKHDSSQQIKQQ